MGMGSAGDWRWWDGRDTKDCVIQSMHLYPLVELKQAKMCHTFSFRAGLLFRFIEHQSRSMAFETSGKEGTRFEIMHCFAITI